MRIGWIIPTIGIFGAVREMVEISNEMVDRGHKVSIFHPEGTPCRWLLCKAAVLPLKNLNRCHLDVLIGIIDWKPEMFHHLTAADSKVKAICLMGFTPSARMAAALRGEAAPEDAAQRIIRDSINSGFLILADSSWQLRWLEENVGISGGVPFGGINLEMFHPPDTPSKRSVQRVLYSGDPRDRKGTEVVEAALQIVKAKRSAIESDFYWNRRFSQGELVEFLGSGDIFLDAHRRAGWCNPVLEAMACGCVPVCTAIGANSDFALDRKTAMVVPLDDEVSMADAALYLLEHLSEREEMARKGLQRVRKFSYTEVAAPFERCLQGRLV